MGMSVLAWIGAMAIGVSLGLLGSGGSILTVPVLVYLIGQDEKLAIAGSLAIVGSIALVGSLPYLKKKLIDWRIVVLFGIPGMAGTYIGAWLATWISGLIQLALFAIVMLLASWQMLKPVVLDWIIIAIVTVLGVLGSFRGSRLAGVVDQHKLRRIFGVFLIIMGIYILARTLPAVWPF